MAAQKVTLYVRQRGTRKLALAKTKNTYPLGTIYVLRYTRNGRRVWETLNNCATLQNARVAAMKKETALLTGDAREFATWNRQYGKNGKPSPSAKAAEQAKFSDAQKLTLAQQKEKFIEYKEGTARKDGTPLDHETVNAYAQQTAEFIASCKHSYPDEVDAVDLRRYMSALRSRGLSHRSVCNHYTAIACFLKFCGVDHKQLLPFSERPTPDDGTPEAYDEREMQAFFAVLSDERQSLAFELFLKAGLRERELTTLEWNDLTFGGNPIRGLVQLSRPIFHALDARAYIIRRRVLS